MIEYLRLKECWWLEGAPNRPLLQKRKASHGRTHQALTYCRSHTIQVKDTQTSPCHGFTPRNNHHMYTTKHPTHACFFYTLTHNRPDGSLSPACIAMCDSALTSPPTLSSALPAWRAKVAADAKAEEGGDDDDDDDDAEG